MNDARSRWSKSALDCALRALGAAMFAIGVGVGAASTAYASAAPLPLGDYTGDGITDMTVWRPSNGYWFSIDSTSGWSISTQWGQAGDIAVAGDFSIGSPDGRTDPTVFRPSDGYWYWIDSATGYGWMQWWGIEGDIPAPGDYDGDGLSDITIWRHFPNSGYPGGMWWIINSHDWSVTGAQWGQEGDIPVPCDYDHDGKSDLAVFRPSDGTWHITFSGGSYGTYYLGLQGDVPVPGDYDGDGTCQLAAWHPANGQWSVLGDSYDDPYYWSVIVGQAGDIPAPGDYDGDGKMDTVVWRPSNGTFYGKRSSDSASIATSWGSGGPNNGGIGSDVPMPNNPGASSLLADILRPQEQDQWCWAATAQMTAAYSGVSMPQCEQANVATGRTDCCTDPAAAADPGRCDVPGWWSQLPNFNFTYSDSSWGSAISFSQLQAETNASRPVPYAWGWTGGGGHAMVAIKTFITSGTPWVSINNPWPPNVGDQSDMTYSTWVSASDHVHWQDSYNVILH